MPPMPLTFHNLLNATRQFDQIEPGILLRDPSNRQTMPFVASLQFFEGDESRGVHEVKCADFDGLGDRSMFEFGGIDVNYTTTSVLPGEKNKMMAFSGDGTAESCCKPAMWHFRVHKRATNRNFKAHKPSSIKFRFAIQPGIDMNKWHAYWVRMGFEHWQVPTVCTVFSEPFTLKTTGSAEYRGSSVAQEKKHAAEKSAELADMSASQLASLVSAPPVERPKKRGRPGATPASAKVAAKATVSKDHVDYASSSASATTNSNAAEQQTTT